MSLLPPPFSSALELLKLDAPPVPGDESRYLRRLVINGPLAQRDVVVGILLLPVHPPPPDVPVHVRVEVDEQQEGHDADADEAEPVEVDGVGGVHAELGDVEDGHVLDLGGGGVVVVLDLHVGQLDLEELGHVHQEAEHAHRDEVLRNAALQGPKQEKIDTFI